jgi:hypothetical protein
MADAILDWDTFVPGDATITTGPQEAYRIRAIGTDKAGAIAPTIDGNELGAIRTEIGSLFVTDSGEQGPLDLEELYYYVPPESTVSFDGASSDTVRLTGEAIDSPSGRFESSADETRFDEQGEYFYTFTQGSVDVAETIADNAEFTIHTLTPATDERFEFVDLHLVSHTSTGTYTVSPGEVALLFDFDGQQRPSQFADDSIVGLDIESLPRPPTATTNAEGFVYGDDAPNVSGFTLGGDRTLQVVGRNTSGGALGNSTDTSTFTYTASVRFRENMR